MSEQQKKKILVMGDGATSSGFARVVKSIFIRLSDHYDIKQLLPFDVSLSGSEPDWPWPFFGIEQGEIARLLDDLQPELILSVNEMHVIRKYMLTCMSLTIRINSGWRKTHEVKLLA